METKNKRDEVIELANRLFIYTDSREWDKLLKEVFAAKVHFDMFSMGAGPARDFQATEICEMWNSGFQGIDHVHHQAGNFIVDFSADDNEAEVFCYAIASHYKMSATHGKTREFVGTYRMHAALTDVGWRIDSFAYNLKYVNGNAELK